MMIGNLEQSIEKKEFKHVYYFFGTERYLIEDYANRIIKALVEEENSFNVEKMSYRNNSIEEIISIANTSPFIGDKKVILVKDSELLKNEKKHSEKDLKTLGDYLENPNPTTCLIFIGELEVKYANRNKVYKSLNKQDSTGVVQFNNIKGAELRKWIQLYLKKKKLKANSEVMDILILIGEKGLFFVKNEIDKIELNIDKSEIELEDVEELLSSTPEAKIFDLIDGIIEKDTKKALDLLDDFLLLGEPVILLRAMLITSFRRLIIIRESLDRGLMKSVFAKNLDTNSNFLIDKSIKQVRGIELGALLDIYDKLYRLEFLTRNSKQDQKKLIKDFILEISIKKA